MGRADRGVAGRRGRRRAADDPPRRRGRRLLHFWEDPDEDSRHADVDLLLATRLHGQGLGTDAMRTIARHLIDTRGHHRITLSTVPANARAIRAYEKAGFRQVGVTRLSERAADGTWHDELLMELVVEPR